MNIHDIAEEITCNIYFPHITDWMNLLRHKPTSTVYTLKESSHQNECNLANMQVNHEILLESVYI